MNSDDLKFTGIYKIELVPMGWVYVGSAVNIANRLSRHKTDLKKNGHTNPYLQRAWNSYGAQQFTFSVLERVDDLSMLIEREQYWMDALEVCGPNGFNMCPTAGNMLGIRKGRSSVEKTAASHRGRKRSEETRAKIREARGRQVITEATRSKLAARGKAWKPSQYMLDRARAVWLGAKHSPETIQKLRVAGTGRPKTEAELEKLRLFNAGKKLPPSAYERSAAYWKGRKHRPETIEKLRQASTGRIFSAEARAKMGAPRKGRAKSAEQIAKRIATFKRNRELAGRAPTGEAFAK